MHLPVLVLALAKACVSQMDAQTIQFMLVVHFTLSDSMDDRIRINSHDTTKTNLVLVETSGHVDDLTDTLHLNVIVELIPEFLEGLLEINLVGVDMGEEEIASLRFLEDLINWPIE